MNLSLKELYEARLRPKPKASSSDVSREPSFTAYVDCFGEEVDGHGRALDNVSRGPGFDANATVDVVKLIDISTSPPSSSSDEFPTSSDDDEDTATEDQVKKGDRI